MGLRNKASKIDFSSLMSTPPAPAAESKAPKTAPGAMMAFANDARSDLLKENEELKAKAERATDLETQLGEAVEDLRAWDGAKPTRLLAPHLIRRSRYANRHESSFESEAFAQLEREIKETGGNVQPIKVRSVAKTDDNVEYEIVFGHRRHEACSRLGLPVLAVIDNLDDRSLFVEMDRENREREDLSPWEQGVMYARALDQHLFSSNRQLATALGIDHSNLGKSLALARLPQDVVEAFASPLDIQLRWAPLLNKGMEEDAAGLQQRALHLREARGDRKPAAILAHLLNSGGATRTVLQPQVLHADGKRAATLRFDLSGRATLTFHVALTPEKQRELEKLATAFVNSM